MAALAEVQELVTKYRAAATANGSDDSSPVLLTRKGFGVASGKSWPLSPSEFWLRLHLVTRISASDKRQQSVAQQLRHRRALMELLSQLSSTPSCRWVEAFESLWWPSVLRPANFKDGFSVGGLQREIGETPKFALAVNRPTLESVEWLFQFIRTDCRDALHSEDWELLRTLKTEDRQQKIELCLDMSSNIIRTSVLRSLVDNLQDYFDVARDSRALKNEDESLRIEYEVTALWCGNCRFLSAAEDLSLLAQLIIPSSSIHSLDLSGVYFNSLNNPSGLDGFQAFVQQTLSPTSPLRSLDFTRTKLDHHCVGAICSALRYSSGLTHLSIAHAIREAHANFKLVWAWIFLAIFHVDSNSKLEHLDVSGLQLQGEELEVLSGMLESPHPGRMVLLLQDGRLPEGEGCEECALPPAQRLFVRLLHGSKVWTNPGSSIVWPQLLSELAEDSEFEYEVMVRLVDWLCILIPGYGCGWVVRSAVKLESIKPSFVVAKSSKTKTRSGFRSLTYHGLEERSCGAIQLARLIGDSLTSLDVPSCGLNTQDLDAMLLGCPTLFRLNVTGNVINDLSPLVRAIEEDRSQITSLGVLVESVNATIAAQVRALLGHPTSKGLINLQLESVYYSADSDEGERAIWADIEHALSVNTTLERLHLSLPHTKAREAAAASIRRFHDQILRYETPMHLKTAFLSVMENVSSPQSMQLLDHMAMSTVFTFATTLAVRRQVNISR